MDLRSTLAAAAAVLAVAPAALHAQSLLAPAIPYGPDDIGGVVRTARGIEAGVWVIAETSDLPTAFARIVVTNEQGQYLIPDLPKANYQVWVRGYGLVDSRPVKSAPGKLVHLRTAVARDEAAAAAIYPGVYWYSMLKIPDKGEFPGSGEKGNGVSEKMKAQHYWIDSLKNSCQSCHALGSIGMRVVPKEFAAAGSSLQACAKRTQAGQAMGNMALGLGGMGHARALKQFADWTDRIAAGELPFDKPRRPQGVERNVVITLWDWSTRTAYLHDAISTDKNHPTVNASGRVYGAPEESSDLVPVLDPVRHAAGEIAHPVRDPATPSSLALSKGRSAYWGDAAIWDGHASIHNPMMDREGRVWFTARIRPAATQPAFCKAGSDHPSAKVMPLEQSARQLSMFDPKTNKWTLIDTCFTTHHLVFGKDPNATLWTSAGQPWSGAVGWLNTRMFLETGDEAKSQGWTPIVVDTNGNGRRDAYVGPNDPLDPARDKQVMAAFYGVMPSPVDDAVWGQAMDVGFSRTDQPGYLIRLAPNGPNPSETSLAELYLPPEGVYGARGLDVTTDGVVWTTFSSGHMGSFDRRKCKGPLNGPQAITGRHCPEGWTIYKYPGPQFKGVDPNGAAEHAYYLWVDQHNTLGLGANVPIASTNGGEALTAIVEGKFVVLRVPYPLGFFTKNVDGRIDDPKAGWKGRGLWTTSGTRANFHGEGGKDARAKVFKFQLRPDPLAH